MGKRFIDDKIWSDPWFQGLDPLFKLFWIYLFSMCDMVGLWEFNPDRAEFDLKKKIPWEKIQDELKEKVIFTTKYWIIKTFIRQQYPNLAKKPKSPLHISVFNQIEKKCLNFDLNSLSIDYGNPIHSLQVKVKEKVEVIEKVKEREKQLWREDTDEGYQEYLKISEPEFDRLYNDWEWIERMKQFYPGGNIRMTLNKMWEQFWGTKAGWKNKRSRKTNDMNWKLTIENNFKKSLVYVPRNGHDEELFQIDLMKKRENDEENFQ